MGERLYLYEIDICGDQWHFGARNKPDALQEYRSLTGDDELPTSINRVPDGRVIVRWNDDEIPPVREALTAKGWLFVEGRGVITCPREM